MPTYNKWFSKLTKEERTILYIIRQEKQKKNKEHWTDEQWEAYCNNPRNKAAYWAKRITNEERNKLENHICEIRKDQWTLMTPTEKLSEKIRHRTRRENFSQEELDKERERGRRNVENMKFEVLYHYSFGTMTCMNPECEVPGGSKNPYSFCVEHINGGGKKHCEKLKKEGIHIYRWLIKNNFPEGFQIYCANCNMLKKKYNKEDYRAPEGSITRRSYRRKIKEVV
jgi:hypothetical protein